MLRATFVTFLMVKTQLRYPFILFLKSWSQNKYFRRRMRVVAELWVILWRRGRCSWRIRMVYSKLISIMLDLRTQVISASFVHLPKTKMKPHSKQDWEQNECVHVFPVKMKLSLKNHSPIGIRYSFVDKQRNSLTPEAGKAIETFAYKKGKIPDGTQIMKMKMKTKARTQLLTTNQDEVGFV